LSFVSQMAGAVTVIGTSTNLIVDSVARQLGHEGFSMFQFLPLAAVCCLAGCGFLLSIGRWLLPSEGDAELSAIQESGHYVTELRIPEGSALIGQSVERAGLSRDYQVYVLELWRDDEDTWAPRSQELREGDVLLVRGRWPNLERLVQEQGLEYQQEAQKEADQVRRNHGAAESGQEEGEPSASPAFSRRMTAEVMIPPSSVLQGHSVEALNRRLPRHSTVLAIQRRRQTIRQQLDDVRLNVGDILLLLVPEAEVAALRGSNDMILISQRETQQPRDWRAALSLLIIAAVVATAALGWVPIAVASVAGGVAMLLTGCVRVQDMYEEVDWKVLFVMAGLIPLGIAFSKTGAAALIASNTIGLASPLGPYVALAVIYLLATVMSETMSDTAAAVVLTPIALSTAKLFDVDPLPFLVAVTFAVSTSFLTPIGHHTNTMVYSAGGYRFLDFMKVGAPLNLIFWGISVVLIPLFWPFGG
jgi:di/tricarboxylate transporter